VALFDLGRYGGELRQNGLLGFLSLPSVVVFQIAYLVSAAVLLGMARPIGSGAVLRIVPRLFWVAVAVYGFSLFVVYEASRRGEFGIGAVATAVLIFFLPSAAFLLLGVPLVIIYAIRKPFAEPDGSAGGSQPFS
jgi:hypothetical protein